MLKLAQLAEAVAATTKKNEKVRLVAEHLRARSVDAAAIDALFLSGRIFPAYAETTLNVGGAMLWHAVKEVAATTDVAMTAAYRAHGDLGAAAYDVLTRRNSQPQSEIDVLEVAQRLHGIAEARRAGMKSAQVIELLRRATPLEAKYLVKLMTGELRIGLRESLVEEAIAKAYSAESKQVQRANMLLGDIGETLRLADAGQLASARMRLFHPIGFMLASPAETAAEAFAEFQHAAVEDKYDGIRAQAHVGCDAGGEPRVRLFSRTLDDISESFPELIAPLAALPEGVILDGEIVAWSAAETEDANAATNAAGRGHALPFSELQKRLGRKRVTHAQMREVPVAYVAFDVLYGFGDFAIDLPLAERARVLDLIFAAARPVQRIPVHGAQGQLAFEPAVRAANLDKHHEADHEPCGLVLRAPVLAADSPAALDQLFDRAQARGNEGLMIKDLASPYTPGRRGRAWVKLKRELATLDVVVTAVEWGHGKRANVLSDYTFAVRSGDELLNVGKAYSGLTDIEIAELTQWFMAHTLEESGFERTVEPTIIIEVAFNAVMRSDRHASGYALRFPRILRLRPDKPPSEIDTLERVREIYEKQKLPRSA
jgi:DNA ligase-1